MVCIGAPAEFAVEYQVLHSHERWLLGTVRVAVAGAMLGDTSQTIVLGSLELFLGDTLGANLSAPELAGLPAPQALARVFEPLYYGAEEDIEYERLVWSPNGLEAFDGLYALLLEAGEQYRFVWAQVPDAPLEPAWRTPELCREAFIPRQTYQRVVGSVLESLRARAPKCE